MSNLTNWVCLFILVVQMAKLTKMRHCPKNLMILKQPLEEKNIRKLKFSNGSNVKNVIFLMRIVGLLHNFSPIVEKQNRYLTK